MKKLIIILSLLVLVSIGAIASNRFVLEGFYQKTKTAEDYNFKLGFGFSLWKNNMYTRIMTHNSDGYDDIGLLAKYDFTNWIPGQWIYPFSVISVNMIHDVWKNVRWRFLQGVGIGINLFHKYKVNFNIDTGINFSQDIKTYIGHVWWWRNRIRLNIKLIDWLYIVGDIVYALPIGKDLHSWNDYIAQLEFRITRDISVIGQLRFYNHQVFNINNNIDHQLKIKVKL